MSGLRFAFLTTFYPPYNFGGDGIGVQRLARGLVRAGHHVTVIHDADAFQVLRRGPDPHAVADEHGVEVVTLRTRVPFLSTLLSQQLGRPVVNGRRIQRLLLEGGYDIINYHNTSLIGGPGLFKYGHAIKLYMAHEHWLVCPTHVLWRHRRELCVGRQCLRCQLHYRRPPQLWRWTNKLEREGRHVDAFIAMSEFSRQKHEEFGFPYPMEVVPYFLEADRTADPSSDANPALHSRPYFLFVGRLERIKGLDEVIPVFRDDGPADLLVAGTGEHEPLLRSQAAGMARVRFLGRLSPEDLRRYYAQALALIVPSVCYETFGIIIIEAFRQGTPVIARRIGPFPELIERGGGLLFSTNAELARAMDQLERDSALRQRLGSQGRQAFADHWQEQVVVPRYLDVVRGVAQRKRNQGVLARLGNQTVRASRPSFGSEVSLSITQGMVS